VRISIETSAFARLLRQTTRVVESRNTVPVLGHVLITVGGGEMTVSATDLDLQVTAAAPAESDANGGYCLDAKLLSGIVGMAADNKITLTSEGPDVILQAGRSKYTLHSLPEEDFPRMEGSDLGDLVEIDLWGLVGPVQFAMSSEEARYYLNGVQLVTRAGKLAAFATDGRRLSTKTGDSILAKLDVIFPRKLVGILPKGMVKAAFANGKVMIVGDGAIIVSRLIDGTFPDCERVIPKDNDKLVQVDGPELRAAAVRVALMNVRGGGVRLSIGGGEIKLAGRGEGGEALDVVATSYDEEPLEIAFNSQYLADVIGALPAGPIQMALASPQSPVLFTSQADGSQRVVLMPMRAA
jgi:DNA polymerase III subunit beta